MTGNTPPPTDREALIEEAGKAIVEVEYPDIAFGLLSEKRKEFRRRQARAALAVFEKSHTLGDDEREAWARVDDALRLWNDGHGLDDPAWTVRRALEMSDALKRLRSAGPRRSEPQGEPSDAQKATIAAEALEQAASDFEHDMGIPEFDEATSTDGHHWEGIADAWEHQGPFMEWLRRRARALRAASEAGGAR